MYEETHFTRKEASKISSASAKKENECENELIKAFTNLLSLLNLIDFHGICPLPPYHGDAIPQCKHHRTWKWLRLSQEDDLLPTSSEGQDSQRFTLWHIPLHDGSEKSRWKMDRDRYGFNWSSRREDWFWNEYWESICGLKGIALSKEYQTLGFVERVQVLAKA